jgi:hypothetical protein
MALPIDVTDPGTQQVPLTNAETQAFGVGVPAQVNANAAVANQPTSAISPNNVRGDDSDVLGQTSQVNAGNVVAQQFASAAVRTVDGDDFKPGGVAVTVNDPGMSNAEENPKIGLGLPVEADGDASRPGRAPTDVTQNNVAGQVYGTGTPRNVFV